MSQSGNERFRVGELRPSQLLHTYGVGAVVDLPRLSAMVMGLDDWEEGYGIEIGEERLLAAVREVLGAQVAALRSPPIPDDPSEAWRDPFGDAARIGVPVAAFPRWMVCPMCRLLAPIRSGLFQLRTDPYRRERSRYDHANCNRAKSPTVVPARFLVACHKGHLDDFPWVDFVHQGQTECRALLRFMEVGASGEAADILIRCDTCGAQRRLVEAPGPDGGQQLPRCRGRWPHLRDFAEEGCGEEMRAILLGASNSWFPERLSLLSVPTESNELERLVEEHWDVVGKATSPDVLAAFRQIGQLRAFGDYTDEEIWQTIQRRNSIGADETDGPVELKAPEWEVFSNPDPSRNSPDFRLRKVDVPREYGQHIDQVVLAERVREVSALVGFTRIDCPEDYRDEPSAMVDRRAPLSRGAPKWTPAVENRGEGIFIRFSEAALSRWHASRAAVQWEGEFMVAHRDWRQARRLTPIEAGFPTLRYVLLHSFAHALMRQFALECGYAAASVRERIYSASPEQDNGPMAGMLIYTAAPDSEGTLGGLVSLGEPSNLGRHIEQALDAMKLCASDPLCSEHHPHRDGTTLHGATCHACLFAPETSCERGNKYLDRAVLVPTLHRDDLAYFA